MNYLLSFLIVLFASTVFADEVTPHDWDLVHHDLVLGHFEGEDACVEAALQAAPGLYDCRTTTLILVEESVPGDPPPPPPPAPGPTPSRYRGIPDPSTVLGFDPYADFAVDEVISGAQGSLRLTRSGTAADPYVIDATSASFSQVRIAGEYVVFLGGRVDAPVGRGAWFHMLECTHCVVRGAEVVGPGVRTGNSAAVGLGNDSAWIGGSIHGFGDRNSTIENDFHGIKVCTHEGIDTNVFILDARIYDNAGDSVQVGDSSRCEANNVYIGGGMFFENRENAVDIKNSNNVVVSGVEMFGFSPTNTDPGSAIVIHDQAKNARVYDNIITDSNIGIVSSGLMGHEITGNSITTNGPQSIGFECRNTYDITFTDNSITATVPVANANCRGTVQSE